MIPPYGWARSKKALVARNVATATDYYKEAYLDGQIILLVNTYNGDTYEGMYTMIHSSFWAVCKQQAVDGSQSPTAFVGFANILQI